MEQPDQRPDQRPEPPSDAPERETMLGWLDFHRATLRLKCAGLDAAQLATTHPPSTLTLGGMLKHLALVEHSWTRQVFLGQPGGEPWHSVDWKADVDWDWHSAADDSPQELFDLHAREVTAADEIIRAAGSFDELAVRPHHSTGAHHSLRWIVGHLIEEYARHNGHADLIRESIDGATGE